MTQHTSEKISEFTENTAPADEVYLPATVGSSSYKVSRSTLLNAYLPKVSPTATAAANTAAIQAAIDLAHTNYLAGSGIVEVRIPEGTYQLGPSTLSETYWNYGVAVLASDGCLSMRDGVRLRCAGIGKTILRPSSPTLDVIHVVDGNNQTIEDLEINGGWTASGAGHGILQVTSANNTATAVENLTIRNYYGHDLGSYGIGIENGYFTNVLVQNFRTKNTGADGIDIKNRPWPANTTKGIILENLYIENPGRRLDGQTGLDIRGRVLANNITVIGVGRSGVEQTGIRFRTAGADEGFGDRASVTNFYITGDSSLTSLGVDVGAADVSVTCGTVDGCRQGVTIGGNGSGTAQRNNIVSVNVLNALAEAFYTYASATAHNKFVGCTAYNSLYGFSMDGANSQIVGCKAISCGTQHRVSGSVIQSELLIGNTFENDFLVMYSATAGRVNIEARGTATDIDVAIDPKGAGLVRMGTHAAKGAEAFTGFITIKDSGGVSRKVMVCS